MRFDKQAAGRACRFIEALPHIKGECAKRRELIRLEPWQCWIVTTVFGWMRRDGTRRYRRGYVEVARKNGKSSLSSGIGLYMMAADGEEGAEVYALATTRDQAGIVWSDAAAMVRRSPALQERLGVEAGAAAISRIATASSFQPLPGDPGDGQNPHCAIVDEYHEHKADRAYEAMYQGMGARSQPLMWVITTAGYDRAGPCYREREYARKVLAGQQIDDSLFAAIYAPDKGDAWDDERTWPKANPNLGVSVSLEQLREACNAAQHSAAKQVTFKTKRLNVWVGAGDAYFNLAQWDACAAPGLALENLHGRRAYLALDLASRVDLCALMAIVELDSGWAVFGRYYLPAATVEANAHGSHAHLADWAADGWITLTEGASTDFSVIRADVIELCSVLEVVDVGFDPFQATQLAGELLREGVPMVELRQTVANLSAPMKEIEGRIADAKVCHNGDPVLAWAMGNVIAYRDAKDNVYPRKAVPENKIDPAVALIMAANRAMLAAPADPDISDYLNDPVML